MKAKSGSERRNKSEMIHIRVTAEDLSRYTAKATASGVSVGELARRCLDGRATPSKTTIAAVADLRRAVGELRRFGGLQKYLMTRKEITPEEAQKNLGNIDIALDEIRRAAVAIQRQFAAEEGAEDD
ncbi:hypothetical protein GeomeDRAFT_3337 [Geobacter metallireducens RCH3]|uniref:Mobilization protein MobB, putative n=1 Tax=Geobacter metallireducens (strain ATCC 53774 / DSM 7210 / GS-15) TaxID=269799 RepID=Q39PP4_GEOMG|nr:hypothetical protein [Geobacter metallireducens]ABB33780.1 mobilization protein MobB, putative [Geobacter metallireducens GS-15]EHP83952.1 hypothetical protein GeomeDRAFT_3337 [Geobacter metallireducens RCH3]